MKIPAPTICGRIDRCWLFVYRTPAEAVADLLPPTLQPMTVGGFAFWNVVVCELSAMRPLGVPASLGLSYRHVAYRLHVQAREKAGPLLEGVHFISSDCDRQIVALVGNLTTDFQFHTARIELGENAGDVESPDAAASFRINRTTPPALSAGSPFPSLRAAAAALEYKPAALSPHRSDAVRVLRVQRDAAAWKWHPVAVAEARWQFFAAKPVEFELCYEVAPVEYRWERTRIVEVKSCGS